MYFKQIIKLDFHIFYFIVRANIECCIFKLFFFVTEERVNLNIRVQSISNKLKNSFSTNLQTVLYISVLT